MPDIRVTCPTCKTQLEIDAAHEGEEVECGNCLQVFVATTKKPKDAGSSGAGSGSSRGSTSRSRASRDDDDDEDDRPRRRRRDDDDDEYDQDDEYYDRPRRRKGNGMATTALVLGILSVLALLCSCIPVLPIACCGGLFAFGFSVGAIITGVIGMKNPENKGLAITGLVLGVLTLLIFLVLFAIGFMVGFAGAMNGNPPPNNNKFR